MNAVVAVSWAWSAVHLFTVFVTGFLYWRTRRLEYAVYGAMGASLSIACAAGAVIAGATSPVDAEFAQTVHAMANGVALAGMVGFAHLVVGRPGAVGLGRVLFFFIGAQPLALTGILYDPNVVVRGADGHLEAGLSMWGTVIAVAACLMAWWAVILVWRGPKAGDHRQREPIIVAAFVLVAAGWSIDVALGLVHRSGIATEQLTSVGGLAISYLLLTQIAATAKGLTLRTHELKHSYDELRHVQEELVRKQQLAAVGELSAVIAHEVRNPITTMKSAVSGLRKGELSESSSSHLRVLDEEAERLNRLVRDLLTYARPVELQFSEVELAPLLDAVLAQVADGSEVDVDMSVSGSIHGDTALLERVFTNIMSNALDAMPDGGSLHIRSEAVDITGTPGVAVHFRDTGEGMDTLVRSRARDPFFTTRPSGTGLGLAIVERIVRAHGGRVELESREDGSTVSILLPERL